VVLFLGCLLHDVGKGLGGNHSERGAERARACVERLGLDADSAERVVFLVRHHLLMSHLAQRRDLSDPKLLLDFASTVGDRVNLRNLYLLTVADVRASSATGWTHWKGELLRELFERTSELLETGTADPSRALAQVEERVGIRQRGARAELQRLGVGAGKIDAVFEVLPRRYFVSHTSRQIARHTLALLGFDPRRTVSVTVRELRGGSSELIVCARDVHGLYSRVAGTLTARNVNILLSNVYTTRSGLALEIYRVATPPGEESERQRVWQEFEASLREVLEGRRRVEDLLRGRRRPMGAAASPSREPPQVEISNQESDFYTIIDVSANDRLGLLYDLTRTLTAHDLEIYISKAATVLDQVADTFYVKDQRGRQLADPDRIEALRRDLLTAALGPDGGGSGG
jgi:[protein-PII] uridylyltransferase